MEKIKYLPIKMIQKREDIDQSLREAAGRNLPEWLSNVDVEERSSMVVSTLDQFYNYFTETEGKIPATLELTMDSKATAKSYRSTIRNIVDVNKKNNIIGLKKDDILIIKIEDQRDLKEMVSNFKSTQKHKDGLATLVDSKKFSPDINVECKDVLKVKLINYQDRDINDQVERQFESKCQAMGLTYQSIHYTKDMNIYKVNYDEKTFVALQSFDAIASIEDMPMLGFSFDSLEQEDEELLEVKEPVDGVEHPTEGVIRLRHCR